MVRLHTRGDLDRHGHGYGSLSFLTFLSLGDESSPPPECGDQVNSLGCGSAEGEHKGLGYVAKMHGGDMMGVKPHFLFSLGSHSKQAGDERNLPQNVSFFHTTHLPFPHHVHDLISL